VSALYQSVTQFIARECQALDDSDFRTWLALFDSDGVYWMPALWDQKDPIHHVSLIYETATLRGLRVRRFEDRDALSLQPPPRSVRHVSNLTLVSDTDAEEVEARAALMMAEYTGRALRCFHAHVRWRLRWRSDGYKIALKRVDLLNCDGVISDILTYL
jgi:3-phenylpropionate/cinnamic acid dioxygenase small subunit